MAKNSLTGLERLVTHSNPRSPVSEAYRQLRTNIQYSSPDKPIRTLLATSTNPEEGKSTTLANLAVAIAQSEKRVMVLDCDLRRPNLHELFGVPNVSGLTSLMVDGGAIDTVVQESGIKNLEIITSGPRPPNPSELLGSNRMEEILGQLRDRADYVLIDSPPIIAVTDAAVLASKVDAVILVISAGRTKRELARKARTLLQNVNANLIGVVLNNVKYDTKLHQYYSGNAS